ncbi:MAG: hypothetical protein WBO23_10235 [Burkholderiales bacterium]
MAMHLRASRRSLGVPLFLAYPVLTHVAVFTGLAYFAWAAWLCLAALAVLAFPGKWGLAGFAGLAGALLFVDAGTLLKLPPVVINLALAVWFGRSLARGEEPVISWFARLVRGTELAPDLARYTRISTLVWTSFFVISAAVAAGLALFASPRTWTVFANGVDYFLVGGLFVAEYVYRRVRFRHHTHAPFLDVVRAVARARGLSPRRTTRR